MRRSLILLLAVLLIACQAPSEQAVGPSESFGAAQDAPRSKLEAAPDAAAPRAPAPAVADRMIIRKAAVFLVVTDAARSLETLRDRVKALGGYLSETYLDKSGSAPTARAVARIPQAKLDAFLAGLADLGTVRSQQVTSEDVGEEYTDLQARLKNLRAEENRLLELYQRAGKVSELLEVEREISRVRGEIERLQGRINYLENRVALSTVEVTLSEQVSPTVPAGWSLGSEVKEAVNALVGLFLGIVSLAIWVVVLAPVWLPLLLLALWIRRRLRARKADHNA